METTLLRHVIRRKVAKLARFSPLALFFCFYILYATMRVKYDDVWSGIYFLSLYGMILELSRLWAPKWVNIACMLVFVPASVYVISFYFFGYDIENIVELAIVVLGTLALTLLKHGASLARYILRR